MSNSKLKKLTIKHLRGAVVPFDLPFERGRLLTILYGENGTGKTTVCDALELLAKGRVGSLEGRGLGTKTERYWPSVGKTQTDISVALETGDGSCTATVNKGVVRADPLDKRPTVEVLRRSQIAHLLEAQPAARYEEIKRFIDVSAIETSESALNGLIQDLKSRRETAIAVVSENQTSIRQFWQAAGSPGKDPFAWAAAEVSDDIAAANTRMQALGGLCAAYQCVADYQKKFESATSVIAVARSAAVSAATKVQEALSHAADGVGDLVQLLEAAKAYLETHPSPTHCPVCESSDKAERLQQRINQRTEQYAGLRNAQSAKTAADHGLKQKENDLAVLHKSLAVDAGAFQIARAAHAWGDSLRMPKEAAPSDAHALSAWLLETAKLPEEWRAAEAALRERGKFLGVLKQQLTNYRTNVQVQKDLDLLLPRLDRTLEITSDERRKFTDGVLKAIAKEVGRLYELVHPGEGLDKISLELDANKRASLDIGASFATAGNTPPQAYFSQSHLDTLGLCVFLALAGLNAPAETILVLDDILASVDEPHVERVIEMLYAETARFRHCIITTHYKPWKEKFRWGWLQNGQCQFVELSKWSLVDGLRLIRSLPETERLRSLLAAENPDIQAISSKAGVVLEAALDFLTQLYECHVPRRADARYTLGDLLPALDKKLRLSLKVEIQVAVKEGVTSTVETVQLGPILDELARIAQVRNVMGAHFNELSFELLDAEAARFAENVLKLIDAMTDQEASWPRSKKSGSYWATSCGTRRLHPLVRPS